MRRMMRRLLIAVVLVLVIVGSSGISANAEVIRNLTGEKDPWGGDYDYKYWTGYKWSYEPDGNYTNYPTKVKYTVEYCYSEAYKMNAYVNAERKAVGVHELEMKDVLMKYAMQRAAETAIYWEHERPDGSCYPSLSKFSHDENIHVGYSTAKLATQAFVESSGHYANMIDDSRYYVGYGCVKVNGTYYWVQIFTNQNVYYENGYDYNNDPEDNNPVLWDSLTVGKLKDTKAKFTAEVNPAFLTMECGSFYPQSGFVHKDRSVINMNTGSRMLAKVYVHSNAQGWHCYVPLTLDQYTVTNLTPELCIYHSSGQVTALGSGTAKLRFVLKENPALSTTMTINITGSGSTLVNVNGTYYYYKDGVRCYDTTLVKYANNWWYVKGGVLCREPALVKYGNDYWYVNNGRISRGTGLLQYNGRWWYVYNGKWYRTTGLVKHGNNWWYVKSGVMVRETTLVKHGRRWYFIQNGRINFNYTGTFVYQNVRWKIVNGVVTGRY